MSHSSISSYHDSLLCIELRRPFHKYSKENEISKEYKASYNKKLIIEDFKRYSARITSKLGFLKFYINKTALFPYGYHGKIQLLCIIMIPFIFFFSETAGSPYVLLFPTSFYPSVFPLGACYPDKFLNEYQEAAKENRRKRKSLRFLKLLMLLNWLLPSFGA